MGAHRGLCVDLYHFPEGGSLVTDPIHQIGRGEGGKEGGKHISSISTFPAPPFKQQNPLLSLFGNGEWQLT